MISYALAATAALLTGVVVAVAIQSRYAARLAAATTERDLLRERVVDLEAAVSEDSETAAVLGPLQEALGRVERHVGSMERERAEQFGAIREVMAKVESGTADLGKATASLAGSMKSSTMRGAWGEVQLRRVLEASGMLPRCDFLEQIQLTGPDGKSRPDVVVSLPGGKHLVIDAKAPMVAFLDAQAEALADADRHRLLQAHARAVRGHVTTLADRQYWAAVPHSPEMVVCFLPSDAMLAAALHIDPGLHDWAMSRRVVLVAPAALMALLRTVAFTWQQDALTQNATELLEIGRELYRRLATLGAHTDKLGRSLRGSVESYNAMVGALESRVLVTARRLADLEMTSEPLPTSPPLTAMPRAVSAPELLTG